MTIYDDTARVDMKVLVEDMAEQRHEASKQSM